MIIVSAEIENELGNRISIDIVQDERGVTLKVTGPGSQVEHTYTPLEAQCVGRLLMMLDPRYQG